MVSNCQYSLFVAVGNAGSRTVCLATRLGNSTFLQPDSNPRLGGHFSSLRLNPALFRLSYSVKRCWTASLVLAEYCDMLKITRIGSPTKTGDFIVKYEPADVEEPRIYTKIEYGTYDY